MAPRTIQPLLDRLLPGLTLLLAIILDLLPLPGPGPRTLAPFLSLVTLFVWTLRRPDRVGPAMAFAAGLLLDLGGGLPPGATALPFMLVQTVVASPRALLQDRSPLALWGMFLAVATAACLLRWLLLSLWWGQLVPLRPALFELALTVAVYPLLAGLIGRSRVAQAARHAPGL